jgi:hypothetical protein
MSASTGSAAGGIYSSLASYFGSSSTTKSQGKAGGTGGGGQQYAAQGSGSASSGDTSNVAPTSGSGWISAAVGLSSSDKSQFTTPFSQQFGGIQNNQVIDSAGAAGATNSSPIAPITSPSQEAQPGTSPLAVSSGSSNPLLLALIVFGAVWLALKFKG